jgi:HD superfamily phosphohydrolase
MGRADELGEAVRRIDSLLRDVAELFSQWVSLLIHVHDPHELAENGYVYLDVKPANVLVDNYLKLTSIDFGSAEKLDPQDQFPTSVFFTEDYAHQTLKDSKQAQASSNRVRGAIQRCRLRPAFDYYALGISMLEILNEIASIRPHVVPQIPLYRSLHFLAARLLDGQNSIRETDRNFKYSSQVFPGLRTEDYAHLRYETLKDTHRDLEKELGRWSLEERLPELASFSKDIVRLVPGYNTVLTPRLRGVIEHPLVARLKFVTQLGLVSLVYPTADHFRYDHSLGSYTYTTYYVKSLFNDLGNPLFRNLVGTADVKAVLLAALLHDLGQYPLAHDLEEVHPGIFKHALIGQKLLEDTMEDKRGRTLLQIIEDPQNGWGVNANALAAIRGAHSRAKNPTLPDHDEKVSLKTNVLAAIIDGQVDADKADYIIRDSVRCELPYGAQLDLERLLRVLTVAIIPEESGPKRVRLGVYDKGLVSAHAFGQARYELLSTVYWHHTSRIIKAMLQYATAIGLPDDVFNPVRTKAEPAEDEIRERLLTFVKSLAPPFDLFFDPPPQAIEEPLDLAAEPPDKVIDTLHVNPSGSSLSEEQKTDWYAGIAWTDWLMLRWIAKLPNATTQSRKLIEGLQQRRLYKRVATFVRGGPQRQLIEKLDDCSWPRKVELCRELHVQVCKRINSKWGSFDTTTLTLTDFEGLSNSNLLILIDVPTASKKIGYDRPLGVVPELKEKSYSQGTRHATEDKPWHDIMVSMIDGIAPVRVLCHPDVRNLVSAVYAPSSPADSSFETQIAEEILRFI